MDIITNKKTVYFCLCLGCVTISFNVAAISAAIPVISSDLRLNDILVSKIIPYYMVPYGIGALIYAPLTRYLSYRIVLCSTFFMYAFASYFCGTISSLNLFLVGRIGMGISGAAAIPLGLMMIGEMFEKNVRGRLVGLFFSCSFFASLAGVMLGGKADWRLLFFVPAILATLTALSFLFFSTSIINKKHKGNINYFKAFKNQKIFNVFIFIGLISALYHGVHKWFGIYLNRIYGLDKFAISFVFILMAVGGFAGQHFGGYFSDKKSRTFTCYLGLLVLSLSTMALAMNSPLAILTVIMVVLSMAWTVGHNGISTILTDFPEKDRPVIASLNSSVRFVAGGIGFFISRYFVEKSFEFTFLGIGILMLLLVFGLKKVMPEK